MDFELIENLSDEQVDELYSDVMDGEEDKLGVWSCHNGIAFIGVKYNGVETTNPPIYVRFAVGSAVVKYVGYNGDVTYHFTSSTGGNWGKRNTAVNARQESYTHAVNKLTGTTRNTDGSVG